MNTMTSKERLQGAINFQETDRPPVYCSVVPQLAEKLCSYMDMPFSPSLDSPMSGLRISWADLMIRLGSDCICIASCAPDVAPTVQREDGLIVNEWGIGMRNHGLYDDFELHPLAHAQTVEDIEAYVFPDVNAAGRFRYAEEAVAKYGQKYGIIGDLECSIFETAWYLVGFEKLLMDMSIGEPYVNVLFDKIVAFHTEVGKRLVSLGADMIWCGDDLGTQNGLLISPDMFDRYFAPRIEKMFAAFKEVNPQVKVAWHSCGSIISLVPRFIELGLNILNPIQPLAKSMNPQWLKETYGDKLVFFGGICVQELLPKGSPKKIEEEVQKIMTVLSKGGGYILAPAHNIQADTSVENVLALFNAVKNFKK